MNQEQSSVRAHRATRLHLSPDVYGKRSEHERTSIGALCGLAGLAALFIGGAVCVAAWLAGGWQWDAWLERIGVALLVLTVPLLAFGAHCFDRADDEQAKAARRKEKS
jgi:hypothetical protein